MKTYINGQNKVADTDMASKYQLGKLYTKVQNHIKLSAEELSSYVNQQNRLVYDFIDNKDNSLINDITELSAKLDNLEITGGIYDDTQIKEDISELSTKLENLEISGGIYDDTQIKADITELSSKLDNLVDNDTIYDDTQIKADITELSSKLENLVDNDTIYDDTQLRSLISAEMENRILADTSLSSEIEILKFDKSDDYTAFEVFPHNFIIQDTGAISNNTAKTVAEMFQPWQKVKSSGGIKFVNVTNTDVGQLNNYYYTVQNNIKSYKRFHPVSGFIDITLEDITELPQIGNINTLYKISNTEYYLYYDEAIRNLRKCLTTAKDDHVFFKLKLGYQLSIKLRTHLSQEQVDNGKSNIIIDWGDGEQTVFKNYTLKNSANYIFNHIYAKQNWNKNLIVKIYGDEYYLLQFNESNYTTSTSMIIVSRIFDYDLPVAKCLTRFPNFCANNLVYSVDIRKCNKLFEGCNIGSMFTTPCLQQVKGFTDDANEFAFNSIYCMNYIFNGVGTLKTIDFKFPALCKLPIFQYIFNGVYFNYGGAPYDILNLFNNFSFNLIPKDETIDVAGMFNNCKNITCSDIEKLGKYLWNNPNLTWKNTSSVFSKVTADFLSGVPVEWGGTLTGWVPPVENTFDDTEIRDLISGEIENRISEDNKLSTAITQLSSVISDGIVANAYTRAETDELLSAKLDTNIFDEYAEQISEELSALTITDADISGQVNELDKKVNLLKAEKSNDYTAFEIFPHDFKLAGSNLDNNTIVTVAQAFANSEYSEYRKCLTSANDDDIFFGFSESKTLYLRFRSYLSKDQITAGVADVVIDWGDNTPVSSYIDATITNSYYDFIHVYEAPYINTNCIVKIYGKDYKDVRTMSYVQYGASGNGQSIVVRAIDYDLPVASHLTAFPSFLANTMIYSLRADRCSYLFNNSNLSEAFRIRTLQRIYGFSTATMKYAFSTSYCLNKVFSGNDIINSIDFKFPARIELPEIYEVFKDVYFNYGKSAFDILKLFDDYSFTNISQHLTLIPAGMFNNCKNITCSNVEKLGKFLWNNPNVKWTNTSSVFANVTADFLSGVPVEWGGTLTGWVPPTENTFDDTEIRELISSETDARISADIGLTEKINLLKAEKLNDYTAFEVFPHDFRIFPFGGYSVETPQGTISNSARIKDVFTDWIPAVVLNSGESTGKNLLDIYYDDTNKIYKRYVYDASAQNYITEYIVSSPLEPDVVVEKMQNLPEIGEYDKLYKVEQTGKVYMYAAYLKQYRKFLPTATDDDIFYDIQGATTLTMSFRTNLSKEQIDANKSDVVIDWGDNTTTTFNEYKSADSNSRTYTFSHDYKETYELNNNTDFRADRKYLVKIIGKDYFGVQTASQHIIINMSTVDCPIASCVKAFNGFFAGRMMFNVDLGYYGPTFYNCNLSEMFYGGTIRQITGFKRAFTDRLYAISFAFQGIKRMNGSKFDFTIPAEVTNANFSKLFYGITFYIDNTTQKYDILKLFNPRSFADMKNYSSVNVDSMFSFCSNITCSDYQKLGKFLWNNTDINWTNTAAVFIGCPDELRANIPEQWGGTLTGWTAPVKLTKEYVDNIITQLQQQIRLLQQDISLLKGSNTN